MKITNRSKLTQAQAIVIAAVVTALVGGIFAVQANVKPVVLSISATQTAEALHTSIPSIYSSMTSAALGNSATQSALASEINFTQQAIVVSVTALAIDPKNYQTTGLQINGPLAQETLLYSEPREENSYIITTLPCGTNIQSNVYYGIIGSDNFWVFVSASPNNIKGWIRFKSMTQIGDCP